MRKMSTIQAVREAIAEEMRRDENVILMGEDVRMNIFGTSAGLLEEFGADRILDTPISEAGFCGTGIGAAMVGMRPIVDFSVASFMFVAMDQIVTMAAKTTYMYGGQYKVPMVMRAGLGYNISNTATHSDRPHAMFMNVPGLKIILPSCAHDMYGLLKSAIRDDDPIIIFEDRTIPMRKEDFPDEEFLIPIGKAKVKREGTDVTLIGIGGYVNKSLEAAEELEKEGISAEVIDPRTLVPLDKMTILKSVRKTGRAVISDPAHKTCSAASEIAAILVQEAFDSLLGPVQVLATADTQIPFSKTLESQLYPSVEKIVAAAKQAMGTK